ncbi:MAG: hypothetical protein E6G56_08270 [Actinobacteria bacterium]|nr:MAG: hypothetical protein E6G56_08270 [Actinomycetota bacterium]
MGRMRALARAQLLAAFAVMVGATAPASADTAPMGSAIAQPHRAGAPSHIVVSGSGSSAGLGGTSPKGITLAVYRGFRLDLRTIAARCTSTANPARCPKSSQVASGSFRGTATYPGGAFPFNGTIQAFLAPPSAGALADVIVVVSVAGMTYSGRGQLVAVAGPVYGYELRADPLPAGAVPAVPAGVTVTLDELSVNVGAARRLRGPRRRAAQGGRRRRGRRCPAGRRGRACRRARGRPRRPTPGRSVKTLNLITNPSVCAGPWPFELRVRYADHTDVRDFGIACSG